MFIRTILTHKTRPIVDLKTFQYVEVAVFRLYLKESKLPLKIIRKNIRGWGEGGGGTGQESGEE